MTIHATPYGKILDAFWQELEGDANFSVLVKPANRIKYNLESDRNPVKGAIATADLPELAIVPQTSNGNLHFTSNASELSVDFQFILNTGDYRYSANVAPLQWLLVCKIAAWKSFLYALTWKGKGFVKAVDFTQGQVGESDPNRNRSIRGWTVLITCRIRCVFNTADMVYSET